MKYKLDLETLSEERLNKSVNQESLELGQGLFEGGQVLVKELTGLTADCIVHDRRNYHVHLKIAKGHLYFKCSCDYGSRGLICEHDVAAWLGIRAELRKQLPPAWHSQLNKMIFSIRAPRPDSPAPYALFFSLQAGALSTWSISPYTLSLSALPDELTLVNENATSEAVGYAIVQAVTENPSLALRALPVYYPLDPGGCQNCPSEAVNLANLFAVKQKENHSAAENIFPLGDCLALITRMNCPLFLGDAKKPLLHRLVVVPEPGEACLNLDRDEQGLHISPRLAIGEQLLLIAPENTWIIGEAEHGGGTWALMGHRLFKVENPSVLGLLPIFGKAHEIVIPAEQENDFREKYYLELARQIRLQGNVVSWEFTEVEPKPRLYLGEVNQELQAQLRFGYAEIETPYNADPPSESIRRKPGSWTLVRVQRQPELEKEMYNRLASPAFGLKRAPHPARPGWFRLRARTHPVDFLLNILPRLAKKGFEIHGEEQLKTARVNRSTPTISFDVSSQIDWFDVKAIIHFGELEVNPKEIHRVMRKRERFIKLPDGSIGEIPEEWFERYKHLFALGEPAGKGGGESLRLARQHFTLIDQALAKADHALADAGFERHREKLQVLLDIVSQRGSQGIMARELPQGFAGELRPYQKAGYDWLHFLREFEFGGCLADDMGLGKTVQALAFLQSIYSASGQEHSPPSEASLLVVPRSLLVNWQREAQRFTPNLRILEYFETNRERDKASFEQADLVITTYGIMLRDIEFLHGYTFHYAILDESQAIKNPQSQTARAAHLLRAKHRLVLTGTPIENSTSELWSQFAFLNPGLLGNQKYFKTEFSAPIEKKGDEAVAHALRSIVYPFILRRTKDQVAPELPPRSERILYSDMEPAQRKLYNHMRDYYRSLLLGLFEAGSGEGELNKRRMKILEGLLRLRQICNHPRLVDKKFRGESGKFELLLDTLETLRSEGHKALVFSQFVQMLSLVRAELDERQIAYSYLDGSTQNRQERVDTFQSDESIPFFLISLKAGGLGLNLTAADYVIHIDPWWNPAVEMQASDRSHRIGQDRPVFVFKLIARDSVEEKIMLLQERKKNLVEQIITTESSFFKSLTQEDIEVLFSD
ncbi:MAG: DEAD/DEAH box helicase [Anaerolineales bacterium]|nr:DEAD/DEAH box helicase [Anaerolineales bacterium]